VGKGEKQMKIIYTSDSPTIATGYGRVSKMLCQSFHDAGHSVTFVGWGYGGEEHSFPYKIIPCDTTRDRFGEDIIANLIRDEKPDILFTLGDPWMTEYISSLEERSAVTTISYFPIDGYPIPKEWHNWIKNIDVPVVFSKFAQNLVFKEVGRQARLIYHGVDTKLFKPLDKNQIKKEHDAENMFVVGTVARNQPRKNLPALIKAFSIFAEKKDDVALYMHSQIIDVGWDIGDLVKRFGIEDKAYTTPNLSALRGVSDEELVKIYNLFDIFVLPTMAEGFGLPILEAQSCGIPVLVTDYSACSELVVDRQELLKAKDTLIMGRNIEQAIVDVDDIVRKLNYFYHDWKKNNSTKLKYYGEKGVELAKTLEWEVVLQQFNELLKEIEPKALERSKRISPTFYII
jgi:glycosyltransferase involved in cell wall biosynthesis